MKNGDLATVNLLVAAEQGFLGIVSLLLANGVDIHTHDDGALLLAAANGHLGVVELLIKSGANLYALNDNAAHLAATNGHLHVLNYLLGEGAILSQPYKGLDSSSSSGYKHIVDYLTANRFPIQDQTEWLEPYDISGFLDHDDGSSAEDSDKD